MFETITEEVRELEGNAYDDATPRGDMFSIDVHSATKENFDRAMRIALSDKERITHYMVDPEAGLILFWADPERGAQTAPAAMDADAAISFAWHWLRSLDHEAVVRFAGKSCEDGDTDWDLGGFHVYNDRPWGHVLNLWQGVVAIKPEYIIKGR